MDNIMNGLKAKADEIEQPQTEIDLLIADSNKLKPTVLRFEETRKKANELKYSLKKMKQSYNNFIEMLRDMDEHYLDINFPLFAGHQAENTRTWLEDNPESPSENNAEGTNG